MNKKIKRTIVLLSLIMLVFTGLVGAAAPKYVFYFIGDGMGASQRQSAQYFLQSEKGEEAKLTMNMLPVAGMITTHSSDSLVTDSAAAGTALATGYKTDNGVIAQLPDGRNVKTLMELARDKGMAAGIVTSTRLTHATPATFVSHNESRYNADQIADEYLESGVEYFAGGGYRYFVPQDGSVAKSKRKDNKNIIQGFADKGYDVFVTESDTAKFRDFTVDGKKKMFAAFTYSHLPYELDRDESQVPSLAEMTAKGINVLNEYEDGFFMMVEGGRIDHACHANDPAGSIHDTIAFDNALKEAYEFYEQHPDETLILVAADHETGGFGLGFGTEYFLKMEAVEKVKLTTADVLNSGAGKYNGDRTELFSFIAENMGLNDLTELEKAKIETAMDMVDTGIEDNSNQYGGYDPVAITVTHIISERANMNWTTYAHSGTAVPISAVGVGAEKLGGFKDNTEIAKAVASIIEVNLDQIAQIEDGNSFAIGK